MPDARCVEVQTIDIGDAPRAVDHARGLNGLRCAVMFEPDLKPAASPFDGIDLDAGLDGDAQPFGLGRQHRHGIGIHPAEKDCGASSRIVTLAPARA